MSLLEELLRSTRARLEETKRKISTEVLEQRIAATESPRGFEAALRRHDLSVIAEIKRASPRAGDLNVELKVAEVARAYRAGGAAAISVLTEPDYFKGSLDDLTAAREVGLPILRKDFILDPFQVLESRAVGADAVLLIVRVTKGNLQELVDATRALAMDPLVEVHEEDEIELAVDAGATMIGINHRDLETFEVDPARTSKLVAGLPQEVLPIALSGVSERAEVEELQSAGARAILIGESLVTSDDPTAKLRTLIGN